jgi:hypothetical protein
MHVARTRRIGALLALAAALAAVAPADAAPPVPAPFSDVAVDFARPIHARSVVGLLHGIDARRPADRLIKPLAPSAWRGDLRSAPYDRVTKLGARYVIVVSDLWGYPGANWYGRRPPWEDLGAWASFVRGLARYPRGQPLIWDIWNEPDQPYFWNGTRAQLYQTYSAAYAVLREELGPRAVIVGPSVSAFHWGWLVGLLEHCRQADCEVNALSWHELPGERSSLATISDHLRRARTWLVRNPAYAVLGLRELHVNETVGGGDGLYPGEQLAYLAELERGHADLGGRACWLEPSGLDECALPTLDGLLEPATMRPRGSWWVTAWYARQVRSRVWSRSGGDSVEVLAARRSPQRGRAEVLIGAFDPHSGVAPTATTVRIALGGLRRLGFLRGRHRVTVRTYRLRSTGAAATGPQAAGARVLPIAAGAAATTVVLRPHEAALLRLSAR